MQAIERAFQEFLRRHRGRLDAARVAYEREGREFGEDPQRVALSLRGALRFLGVHAVSEKLVGELGRADELQAWAAYRAAKQVYAIEEALVDALGAASWPEGLRTEAVFLPVNGVVIRLRLSGEETRADFVAFHDFGAEGELLLRVVRLTPGGGFVPCALLHLGAARLQETLDEQRAKDEAFVQERTSRRGEDVVSRRFDAEAARFDNALAERGLLLRQILNVILYINGNDDVVRRVHPGSKERRHRRPGADEQAPEIATVGRKFVTMLEHWEIEDQGDGQGSSHAQPRPHLRRAHLHLYWTGRGHMIPKFVLVRPTRVGGRFDGVPIVRGVA
jgi:hypothetical protein